MSRSGDITIDTTQPVHAALVAPAGRVRLTAPGGCSIRGLIAALRCDLQPQNGARHSLTYDSQYDWADQTAWRQSFRLILEDTPRVFTARLD